MSEVDKSVIKAKGLLSDGEFEKAARAFDKVIKAAPDVSVGYFGKAEASIGVPKFSIVEVAQLYKKAIEITRTAQGEEHPSYAASLNNLAALYESMGDYTKAEPLFKEAMEIMRRAVGEDHPDYATSLYNLARLHSMKGEYAKAEPIFKQALEIRWKALGEDHPD